MGGLRGTYVIILASVLLAGALYASRGGLERYPEVERIGTGVSSFEELSERFKKVADEKGALYAFTILRLAPLPPGTDLHLLGHVVGDELYAQEGINAVADCTQDFRNACSHAIVIGALNEFGTADSTIKKIREACLKAPGGLGAYTMCFHGLGHGVFAYFGYDLSKAVPFCKEFGTEAHGYQEYAQCVGGITMELMGGGGHDQAAWSAAQGRYLNAKDPLAPCDGPLIPDETKSFCYIYLTPHLFEAAGANLGNPDPSTFPKAFGFCSAIGDARLRNTCYGSFGKEFIPLAGARDIREVDGFSDEQYRLAISWCELAPTLEAQSACIGQELASVFWGGENDPSASFRFCSLVAGEELQNVCYDELSRNIASYATGQKRSALCARLPERLQEECLNSEIAPQDRP